jgi:hypothetical protein
MPRVSQNSRQTRLPTLSIKRSLRAIRFPSERAVPESRPNALVQLQAHLTMRAQRAIQECLSAATFVIRQGRYSQLPLTDMDAMKLAPIDHHTCSAPIVAVRARAFRARQVRTETTSTCATKQNTMNP